MKDETQLAADNIVRIINYVRTEILSEKWSPYSFKLPDEKSAVVYSDIDGHEVVIYDNNDIAFIRIGVNTNRMGRSTMGNSNIYDEWANFCTSQDMYYNNKAKLTKDKEVLDITEYFNYSTIFDLPTYDLYEFIMEIKNNLPPKINFININFTAMTLFEFAELDIINTYINTEVL